MDNKINDEVKDVVWKSTENQGEIKFRKNNRRKIAHNFLKVVTFLIIAAISGGLAGAYIVNQKLSGKGNLAGQYSFPQLSEGEKNKVDVSKNSINKVSETVGPAVVGISNKAEGFLGKQSLGSGSGIIFDASGYIVTNNHVIEGGDKITVKLASGKILEAKVVGKDPRSDLAVIKVEAKNLPIAKLGDSSKVKVGDVAIAIGNPLGDEFAGSVTAGIVSALNRKIQYEGAIYKVLQTDAAINPGNSGGALCNENSEVIGINSLKLGANLNAEGMGFAITSNEAKEIVKSLMDHGKVSRPWVGIAGQSVASEEKNVKGIYVQEVIPESGAAAAGIKPTDIIIELDAKKITVFEDITSVLEKHKIGDKISVKLWRKGKIVEANLTLTEQKEVNK